MEQILFPQPVLLPINISTQYIWLLLLYPIVLLNFEKYSYNFKGYKILYKKKKCVDKIKLILLENE